MSIVMVQPPLTKHLLSAKMEVLDLYHFQAYCFWESKDKSLSKKTKDKLRAIDSGAPVHYCNHERHFKHVIKVTISVIITYDEKVKEKSKFTCKCGCFFKTLAGWLTCNQQKAAKELEQIEKIKLDIVKTQNFLRF